MGSAITALSGGNRITCRLGVIEFHVDRIFTVCHHTSTADVVQHLCFFADGVMREGFLAGYDHPKMAGLWPTEEAAAGYK